MADPTPRPDAGDEGSRSESTRGTPLWAKVIGIVVGALVLLFAIKMFTVGGGFDLESLHKRFAGMHGG